MFVFPDGKAAHEAERLNALVPPAQGAPALVSRNDRVDVQYEDDRIAIVLVRSTWTYGDLPGEPYLATHVWIHSSSGWRLLSA